MPQNGFHGLAGLATARLVAPRVPEEAGHFATAVTFGAMLPDVDMYPTAIVSLAGRADLIYVVHRSATHSVLLVCLLAVAGLLLMRRRPGPGWVALGLALGAATHLFLDLFFWFAPLDLFWPFSHLPAGHPLLPVVNLWSRAHIPALAYSLRDAFEFAALALFLAALGTVRAKAGATDGAGALHRWRRALWVAFCVATATAFALVDRRDLQVALVNAPLLLVFLPFCWVVTLRSARWIDRWAAGAAQPRVQA